MKLLHISDLHVGRMLHGFSLAEEQNEVLRRICDTAIAEQVDAILIAGDVYDRSIPTTESVRVLSRFLEELTAIGKPVMMVSGNHDGQERLGFLSPLLEKAGLHIASVFRGEMGKVTLSDEHGEVDMWLLPFIRPYMVRPFFPDEEIASTHDAVRCVINHADIDRTRRNVLLAHQFVIGAELSRSEETIAQRRQFTVGDSDVVGAEAFGAFDYVALGHIHRAQTLCGGRIRYCGTPMPYDFGEIGQEKSVTIVDLAADGQVGIRTVALPIPRRLQELCGTMDEVTSPDCLRTVDRDAFTRIILTEEPTGPNPIDHLRRCYPYLCSMEIEKPAMHDALPMNAVQVDAELTAMELFEAFYRSRHGEQGMSAEQTRHVQQLIDRMNRGEDE